MFYHFERISNRISNQQLGERGVEGMIEAARWAREQRVPYLGICLGLQVRLALLFEC